MKTQIDLIKDETLFEPSNAPLSVSLSLSQCLERGLLVAPASKKRLFATDDMIALTDGETTYSMTAGCPVLYPTEITAAWVDSALPLAYCSSALQQYVLLSQIKQQGEINSPLDSTPARKHQHRFKEFCKELKGLVLDVGCDLPSHSRSLLPASCEYLGIDPYAAQGEFRIIGLGEILPIQAESIDNVMYNTSLDHILDYKTAIDEALRVLKPGGNVVIATYAWLDRATLLTDSVHFHHLREYEILGALADRFKTQDIRRYEDPKHAQHRYGLYIRASKQRSPGV